ncbi:MAG: hypothetical protein IJW85_08845, partial [Clostridia bacterium]|nr:hypothetical protein [Clostridia bacterium]
VGFLKDAPEIAPTYYAIGNHERRSPQREEYWPLVLRSRAVVLDNTFTLFEGIVLGSLSSAWPGRSKQISWQLWRRRMASSCFCATIRNTLNPMCSSMIST